jgi:hypothetical protein
MVCCNHPKAISCYAEYIRQCSDNGIEGILIDEPAPQDCFCEFCQSKFRHNFEQELLKCEDLHLYAAFQEKTVIDFVELSVDTVKQINKEVETSVCIMPQNKSLFDRIASIQNLDVFSTDPYWLRPVNGLTLQSAIKVGLSAKDFARKYNKSFLLFLGCFGIASGLEEYIYSEGCELIESVSPDSLAVWSYRGGIGLSDLSAEECDNPDLAWSYAVKALRRCSSYV